MRVLIPALLLPLVIPAPAFALLDPVVTKGPVISGVTQTEAWVAWETAHHQGSGTECSLEGNTSTPTLTLSPAGMDGSKFTDSACDVDHRVRITGLNPAKKYTFTLDQPWDSSAALTGPVTGTFLTAPPTTEGTFSFVIYGDTRDNPIVESSTQSDHQAVVSAIVAHEMSSTFLVNTGDMALNMPAVSGDDRGYTEFFDVERALESSRGVFTVIGNHETIDTAEYDALVNANGFPGTSPHPYYWSMDWGQVHITFLDAFEGSVNLEELGARDPEITDKQAAWAEKDLAAAQAAGQMLFIVSHQGPYSFSTDSSAHGGSADFVSKIQPLMLKYGVMAVFAGHDHYYQRGHDGCIDYFVIGGGGADQYMPDPTGMGVEFTQQVLSYVVVNVDGSGAKGVAKNTSGTVIDTFTFEVPDGTSCGVSADAGVPDAGGTVNDAGTMEDGGVIDDGGSVDDAGGAPDGGTDDGGPTTDDAGTQDGGVVEDAGTTDDAGGTSPVDAGSPTTHDAGSPAPHDAGSVTAAPDAGSPITPDAGSPITPDAGSPITPDAGSPIEDAGPSTVDAGQTDTTDSGSTEPRPDAGNPAVPAGGCGCGSTDPASALLLLGLAIMRRRRRA